MKVLDTYVIDDSSCLRITFCSSQTDKTKIMTYARSKSNCPYFRVMNAKKPYVVSKKQLLSVTDDEEVYKLIPVGEII